jgi:hypothetical protein
VRIELTTETLITRYSGTATFTIDLETFGENVFTKTHAND